MSSAISRVIVALIFIPLVVAVIILGSLWFSAFIAGLMILGLLEFRRLTLQKNASLSLWVTLPFVPALAWIAHQNRPDMLYPLMLAFPVILLAAELFRSEGSPLLNASAAFLSLAYAGLMMTAMILLRNTSLSADPADMAGMQIIFTILGGIWSCDTLAYYGGRMFGRHKLFERVSPNKTWEGALSGFAGAFAGGFLVKLIFIQGGYPFELSTQDIIVVAFLAGTAGQLGELAESWMKRDAGVKDSGSLLPGHGGILDRFDSLLFVAPSVYIYFAFLR